MTNGSELRITSYPAMGVERRQLARRGIPQHEIDGGDVDRAQLEAMVGMQRQAVTEPRVERIGNVDRIRRVGEHAAGHFVEGGSVESGVGELLGARGIDRMPVHDRGTGVGAATRIRCALRRLLRNVAVDSRGYRLVEPDLDDDGIVLHARTTMQFYSCSMRVARSPRRGSP